MANEITINALLSVTNGNHSVSASASNLRVDQAAQGGSGGVVSVGTSEENLAVGDVSTPGWVFLRNLDSTNYVTYGPDDTGMVAFGRLEAGECALLRLDPSVTLRWQADTAAVNVYYELLED